jgi:hypothetical protein
MRSNTRSATPLAAFAVLACSMACSDAETPNANYEAGFVDVDAGVDVGGRDQPCTSANRCDNNTLTCVSGAGANANICRLECDEAATNDPCGALSTCRPLQNSGGVCLPASTLDGPCPCDEGFACVNLGGNICKVACAVGIDGGPDDCPGDAGDCRPFQGGPDGGLRDDGVCLTD